MATQIALHGKKRLTAEAAARDCKDLLRRLVSQLTAPDNSASSTGKQSNQGHQEEILLDVELDGAHYLLLRLPLERPQRVPLSPREQEIVRMVAHGHSNKIIADVLNISSWTVCTHLRRIFAKLGVGSRAAMVAKTLEESRIWDRAPSPEKVVATAVLAPGNSQPASSRHGIAHKPRPGDGHSWRSAS